VKNEVVRRLLYQPAQLNIRNIYAKLVIIDIMILKKIGRHKGWRDVLVI
jgi:hypothetical protein